MKDLYLVKVIEHYKDMLDDYYERLKVYPDTTYSRPYLYVFTDFRNEIDCYAIDERCTNQLYAEEILEEIDDVPTVQELGRIIESYKQKVVRV